MDLNISIQNRFLLHKPVSGPNISILCSRLSSPKKDREPDRAPFVAADERGHEGTEDGADAARREQHAQPPGIDVNDVSGVGRQELGVLGMHEQTGHDQQQDDRMQDAVAPQEANAGGHRGEDVLARGRTRRRRAHEDERDHDRQRRERVRVERNGHAGRENQRPGCVAIRRARLFPSGSDPRMWPSLGPTLNAPGRPAAGGFPPASS